MIYYMVCDKDGLKGLIYPKLKDKNPDFKITESLNKSFMYFLYKIKRKKERVPMSRKNHKMIDGKFLQTDKKYSHLKLKRSAS